MATNKKLSAVITIGGAISSSLRSTFGDVKGRLGELGKTVKDLERRHRDMGKAIQQLGREGTRSLDPWRAAYAKLTDQLDKARRAHDRLATAQARAEKIGGFVKGAGIAVGAAATAGAVVGRPLIREAKQMENEQARIRALGFSKEDSDYLLKTATAQKAFGVSAVAATETARDLASAFGDVHHATSALPLALKQRFALGLYDQSNGTNLAEHAAYSMGKVIELRNGTKDEAEYNKQANMAHQVMVATGGRITGEAMQAALRTGGIAAKAMSDEAFYYGGSHLMQEMGGDTFGTASMSLYQALAQGRVTKRAANNMERMGLIADHSKVVEDKAGQVKFLDPGALIGYDLFAKDPQAWVEKYFIPVLKKNGIDPDDMQKVAEVAGQIVSNRNGANMLATRVAQRGVIAKEAANAARADNIEQSAARARETAAGKEAQAHARLEDAYLRMGNVLLPVYASAMEKIASILESVNKLAEESPTAFKALTWGLVGVTAAVAGLTATSLASKLAVTGLTGASALGGLPAVATAASTGIMGFLGKLGAVGLLSGVALGAAKAMGLPDTDEAKGRAALARGDWLAASAYLPAGDFLAASWKRITTGKNPGVGEDKNDRLARELPAVPKPATAAVPTTDARQYSFTINQAPGQDSKALADEIERRLGIKAGIKNRSSMFDGVN
jgi:hypothetical protein